ncbi:hypothetical protein CYMTET_14885 [Cymbomonas tetramitiformis]|uniref:EGF-like domain-containing protein n=1 Tax=Cymbomonas tetramitiformis TaxID=36881 RepID=A0AAE0L9W3_9CHLO|nr:hypothetical protein CYMTET_14885 [Cymbomonas tetramitiformis]
MGYWRIAVNGDGHWNDLDDGMWLSLWYPSGGYCLFEGVGDSSAAGSIYVQCLGAFSPAGGLVIDTHFMGYWHLVVNGDGHWNDLDDGMWLSLWYPSDGVNNGNCDPLTSCSQSSALVTPFCGACPAGFSGTGDTACLEEDGCAAEPCFPGVECVDIPAPGVGRACGSCPEGYRGDGGACELCTMALHMDPAMSSIADGGQVKRSTGNQLVAAFDGLNEADCTFSQGVQYIWRGTSSNGVVTELDSDVNRRETPTLYLPEGTLTTGVEYAMQLTATLAGNGKVTAATRTRFSVVSQPLVALIRGGPVYTGEGLPVELDAGDSYDPDGIEEKMTFRWTCVKTARTTSATEKYCRTVSGQLLSPSSLIGPRLSLKLQGSAEGSEYLLSCLVTKLTRSANASTLLTIGLGKELPVPAISPLRTKQNTGSKLTLTSQVVSTQPETLSLAWTVEPVEGTGPAVDLAEAASTSLSSLDLVIFPNMLAEGLTYRFSLSCTDANGVAWTSSDVRVNSPPHSGTYHVSPAEGFVYETAFEHEGSDWKDDADDMPLWYQLRYQVVGASDGGAPEMLTQWQPSGMFQHLVAGSGAEEHLHQVTVYLFVQDSLGAQASAAQNVTVKPLAFEDRAAQDQYLLDGLEDAAQEIRIGQDPCDAILSLSAILNVESFQNKWSPMTDDELHELADAGEGASGLLNVSGEEEALLRARQAQRETMLSLTRDAWGGLLSQTTDTITRVAELVASITPVPAELTAASRSEVLLIGESLVARTRSSTHASPSPSRVPQLGLKAAHALANGLSGAVLSVAGNTNQSVEVTAAVEIMHAAAFSAMQHMVPGEQPAVVSSAVVSSVAQCDDIGSNATRIFTEPLQSPSGAAVTFRRSLADALLESSEGVTEGRRIMYTALVSSAVDWHHDNDTVLSRHGAGSENTTRSRRKLLAPGKLLSDGVLSNVTSISLYNGTQEDDVLSVHGLEEAFTFTLALRSPGEQHPNTAVNTGSQDFPHDPQVADVEWLLPEAGGEGRSMRSPGSAHCAFFYDATHTADNETAAGGYYSTEGCTTMPNPLPAGATTFWREANVSMLESLDAAWEVTNTTLLSGCREAWVEALADEATDAWEDGRAMAAGSSRKVRAYVGEDCAISDPRNEAGCWWDWRLQAFAGPGCVWTPQLGCMCTHLTDFAAAQSTNMGTRRFPTEVAVLDYNDAASLSAAGIASSTALLTVLSVFMLGSCLLFCVSNWFHNRERMLLLIALVNPIGGTFSSFGEVWTWSLVDNVGTAHDVRLSAPNTPAQKADHHPDSDQTRPLDAAARPPLATGWSLRTRKHRRRSLGQAMAQLAATADAVYDSVDTDDDISSIHDSHDSVSEDGDVNRVCRRYSNSPPSVEGAELEAANRDQQQVLNAFKRRSVISCFMPRMSFAAMNASGSDDDHGERTHGNNAADRTMHRTSQPLRERNPPSDVSTSTVTAGDEHSPQMSDSSSTLLSRQELRDAQMPSQDDTQQSDAGKVAGEEMQTQRGENVVLGNTRSNSPAHVVQVYVDQAAHAGPTCRLKHPASMSDMHRTMSVRRLQSGKRRRPPPRAASTEHSSMQPALLLQRPATQAALRVLPFALFDSDDGDQMLLTQRATLGNTAATDDINLGGVGVLDLRYTSSGTTDHDVARPDKHTSCSLESARAGLPADLCSPPSSVVDGYMSSEHILDEESWRRAVHTELLGMGPSSYDDGSGPHGTVCSCEQDPRLWQSSPAPRHRQGRSLKALWHRVCATFSALGSSRGGRDSNSGRMSHTRGRSVRRAALLLRAAPGKPKARWNPFRAVRSQFEQDGHPPVQRSRHHRPSPKRASRSVSASQNVRVLNARALFKILKINIFRLQLCIPLDYLEEVARQDYCRRKSELPSLDSHLEIEKTRVDPVSFAGFQSADSHNAAQRLEEASPAGAAASHAQSSAEAVAEASTSAADPEADDYCQEPGKVVRARKMQQRVSSKTSSKLSSPSSKSLKAAISRNFLSGYFFSTSVSRKRLLQHQRVRTSVASLAARRETSRDGIATTPDGAHRRGSTPQWQPQHLPVERMLGTALVQAFLSMNAILSKQDLNAQSVQASLLPWQMSDDRPFSWYVSTFKVFLTSLKGAGWYQRSHLWNLLFLQRSDGSYKMSVHLATVLKTGRPLEDLTSNPVAAFDPLVLEESMPRDLMEKLGLEVEIDVPDARSGASSPGTATHDLWATLLAVQRLRAFPFTWIENPDAAPWEQVSIQSKSERFIAGLCQRHPALQNRLVELEEIASEYIQDWSEKHNSRIADMYAAQQSLGHPPGGHSFSERLRRSFQDTFRQRMAKEGSLQRGTKAGWKSFKQKVSWLAKAHPLTAIFLVTATEPFTRSDRILVQANTFICMLLFAVFFFYTKAANCCIQLRTHLACPSSSDLDAPCLGFPTCAALLIVADYGDAAPEELLTGEDILCTAFPQSTYVDRIWMILIMIGILTPLTIMLSNLFVAAANADIPRNFQIRQVPKNVVGDAGITFAVLQTVLLTLYALFFKFEKMNKAIAVTFVAVIGAIVKSERVQAALAFICCCCCCCRPSDASARNRERALLSEFGMSSLQASMQAVAYCIIAVLWFAIAWGLLTYAMLFRDMMSAEAENDFFRLWAISFGLSLFGVETIQIIIVQIFAKLIGVQIHVLFEDIDPAVLWFEKFVISKMSSEDEGEDNRQNDDDAGDQDMGDDADAFGGIHDAMRDAN